AVATLRRRAHALARYTPAHALLVARPRKALTPRCHVRRSTCSQHPHRVDDAQLAAARERSLDFSLAVSLVVSAHLHACDGFDAKGSGERTGAVPSSARQTQRHRAAWTLPRCLSSAPATC